MTTATPEIVPHRTSFADYLQLTKPRIVLLLIFTTVTAMVVASQNIFLNPLTLAATIVGGSFAAAGASVLNQYLERDLDRQMSRTKNRPLPAGRIDPVNALLFGLGLLIWSMLILVVFVNWTHRAPGADRCYLLCGRLHAAPEKEHRAEYRRGRRCGCDAGAGRLGGGNRPSCPRSISALCAHFFLDTAAQLGFSHHDRERLRQRWNPDDACGIGVRDHPLANRLVFAAARDFDAASLALRNASWGLFRCCDSFRCGSALSSTALA